MRKNHYEIFFLSLTLVILNLLIPSYTQAHSGRTNPAGCHKVRKTGGYHCHNSSTPSYTPRKYIQIPTDELYEPYVEYKLKACLTDDNVDVRSIPKLNSEVIKKLQKNQCVFAVDNLINSDGCLWRKVILSDGRSGYYIVDNYYNR